MINLTITRYLFKKFNLNNNKNLLSINESLGLKDGGIEDQLLAIKNKRGKSKSAKKS